MKLLTKEIEKKLPKLYETDGIKAEEKTAIVKFFTPWSNWTWYAVEYDPVDKIFFGYVEGFDAEWGYFGLEQLEEIVGPAGLKIERDRFFKPTKMNEIIK